VILVCGLQNEPPIALLIHALRELDTSFMFLDQDQFANSVRCHWRLSDNELSGQITVGDQVVALDQIQSVYTRFMPVDKLPSVIKQPSRAEHIRSVTNALVDLFDVIPARIVNPRRAMMSNNSKPYQALIIRDAGFAIPETIITNQFERVLAFQETHDELVYKSASAVRSIVKILGSQEATRLAQVCYLPTQFQNRITGFNVRVHVVGTEVFACKIVTGATDYRYAALDKEKATFTSYELTDDLRERCMDLAERCGMSFVGIDLIISEEGVFCLEVNPSPAYSYYESATGAPISHALARHLAEPVPLQD
jgi:glutathione synthase/RimK-type ligase-like ATP-grasp enzyme